MHEFRVTKYNPANRDEYGVYQSDEWILFSQVGQECNGVILTLQEYERIESAYIRAALAFLEEAGANSMLICDLENPFKRLVENQHVTEKQSITIEKLPAYFRTVLRDSIWCRFESHDDVFVHFGWDYYMYIGVPTQCQSAQEIARNLGLFVENFESPYKLA